ncbi:phosphohydrolase [bacterium]|nr:phosphohydrolase [bacterium]
MIKNRLLLLLLIVNIVIYAQSPDASTPIRIILNLTERPSSEIAVTWRAISEVTEPKIQIAESEQWIGFKKKTVTVVAVKEKFLTDRSETVFHYSAVIKDLKANTMYVYRVGSDSIWSEWNQFTTAKNTIEPFTFTFFGDPQNDLKEDCSRMFRQAFKTSPNSQFWLFTGDLLSEPVDKQYEELFFAAEPFFSMIPSIMTAGNHDIDFLTKDGQFVLDEKGRKKRGKEVSSIYRAHFTLPENGLAGFEESSYHLDYQGVRIIMINSNKKDKLSELALWMEKLLQNNPCNWVIVAFHHPIYSSGDERDDLDTRKTFQPLFDKYDVDLVLTGHDHTYSRSRKIKDGRPVEDVEKGTVYVVSVSGPKMYSVNSSYKNLMVKIGGNVQLFQTIGFEGDKLSFKSYTVEGKLYDSFELHK